MLADYPLEQIVPYIDWSPFFQTWELKGKYPAIFDDPTVGEEAAQVICRCQAAARRRSWRISGCKASGGVWLLAGQFAGRRHRALTPTKPASTSSPGSTCSASSGSARGATSSSRWPTLSPRSKAAGLIIWARSPSTAGLGIEPALERSRRTTTIISSIMLKALADRLAEAFAELLHKIARDDWGYGKDEKLSTDDLIDEKYRGIRPAPGYPACPDHTEKRILFDLLEAEKNTGIRLTESFAMYPAAAVSGLYFAHPQSRYFSVDRITKDQVEAYAARKGMPIAEVERWLSPNLGYEP